METLTESYWWAVAGEFDEESSSAWYAYGYLDCIRGLSYKFCLDQYRREGGFDKLRPYWEMGFQDAKGDLLP